MSWSVSCFGKPAAVKAKLTEQFASAKVNCASMPHEVAGIGHVEALINSELDFHLEIGTDVVKVEANGHAYRSTVNKGSSQVTASVTSVGGFVE